jgi:hypothetical protein
MRTVIFALVVMVASPAVAGGLAMPGTQHHGRAFWLNDQSWHDPQAHPEKAPKAKFTTTYLDGVAARFSAAAGIGEGHGDLFERKLGGSYAPAFVATVDNGAPMLMLRWHPGE